MRRIRPAGHSCPAQTPAADRDGLRIPIRSDHDILEARKRARELAAEMEFPAIDRTVIASAISELGRNIVRFAERGEIRLRRHQTLDSTAMVITATDHGPGIRDLRAVLQEGNSPGGKLGLGLPGVRRIMDDFEIVSRPRQGTTVTVKKWKPR